MNRFGYNVLVLIWLVPLALADLAGNTVNTGNLAEYYFWMFTADCFIGAYAIYMLIFADPTHHVNHVVQRVNDPNDTVVSFETLGGMEYVYTGFLTVYAVVCFYFMHKLNRETTGFESIGALIWSFLSLGVAVLSANQFIHTARGKLTVAIHRMTD